MADPTAENDEARDWVVHDMAHDHRLCLDDKHPAEFGPMTEREAKAMQARNPRGYWAQRLTTPPEGASGDRG
jgi:hypothetical protein